MYDVSDFWDRLKTLLKNKNYTMKQLSIELGYSEKAYDVKKATGTLPVTFDIIAIAEKFNVSTDWLLLGKTENSLDSLSPKQKAFIIKTIENLKDYEQN